MARTTMKIKCSNPQAFKEHAERILQSHNYKMMYENNEYVWKCGVGFWTAMKYVKIEACENNIFVLSGWIRATMGKEQNLDGILGALPKKQVRNVLQEIKDAIYAGL